MRRVKSFSEIICKLEEQLVYACIMKSVNYVKDDHTLRGTRESKEESNAERKKNTRNCLKKSSSMPVIFPISSPTYSASSSKTIDHISKGVICKPKPKCLVSYSEFLKLHPNATKKERQNAIRDFYNTLLD